MCNVCHVCKQNECPACGAQLNDLPDQNKMKDLAKMFNKELNEKFNIVGAKNDYCFKIDGLYNLTKNHYDNNIMPWLLTGKERIHNFPQRGDKYYYPSFIDLESVMDSRWGNSNYDRMIQKRVGIYPTKEEAIEKAKELGWVE